MIDSVPKYLKDDTPLAHKLVRIILFLTSFSWTFNKIQDYMSESTPIEKIATRMIPMFIVAVYCVTCSNKHLLKRMFRPGMIPLLWYVLWGVMGGMTSTQPALCIWKGAEILITMMWVTVSCSDVESTKRELVCLGRYIEILLWVTVALAVINPSLGTIPSMSFIPWLRGYFPLLNPNTIGFLSVMAMIRLLFFPAKYKPIRMMLVAGTLLCAQSRTSYAVMMVAFLIFVFDGLKTRNLPRVIGASFFSVLALMLAMGWLESILTVVLRGESAEEIQTLSGRTDYWEFAFNHISWTGNGLATGSRSLIFIGEETFKKGSVNMHNSFVEALIGAGYIGAIPFLASIVINIVRQLFSTLRKSDTAESMFGVCGVMFAARSMTSIVLAIFSCDFLMMLIFFNWVWCVRHESVENKVKERPKPMVYQKTLNEQAMSRSLAIDLAAIKMEDAEDDNGENNRVQNDSQAEDS